MTNAWIGRTTDALLCALALAGISSLVVLLLGGTVPDWIVWLGLLLGLLCSRPVLVDVPAGRPSPWIGALLLLVFAATLLALAYGAVATSSRHWDGAVAWDLKAGFLAAEPTLQQPFFSGPQVLHHSRDYPLLMPALVAMLERTLGCGRLLFPLSWVLAAAAVYVAASRRGCRAPFAAVGAMAFAMTPALLGPHGGGVDSGYADFMLCAWLTVAGAGCIGRDGRWVAFGVVLAVLTKPEGLPYAMALLAASWLCGSSGLVRATAVGLAGGALVLLPLQHELMFGDRRPLPWTVFPIAVLPPLLAWGSDELLKRTGCRLRRSWILAALALVAFIQLPWLASAVGNEGGSIGRLLRDSAQLSQRLERLPSILGAAFDYVLLRGWFGLVAPLLALAWWWRRRHVPLGDAVGVVGLWIVLLLPIWVGSFLLSDIEIGHHLRSRLPRLMIHATGLAWIYIVATWTDLLAARAQASSCAGLSAAPPSAESRA